MDITLLKTEKIEDLMVGNLKIIQDSTLYKFTSDAVMLSRFAKKNCKKIIDLCSGSGIVGLHYYGLNGGESVTLCEIQSSLAKMSEKSIILNDLTDVFTVKNMPLQELDSSNYDLVLCNPPYKKVGCGLKAEDEHIAICRNEVTVTLLDIVKKASELLKNGGHFAICHRVERLQEITNLFTQYNFGIEKLNIVLGKNDKPYLLLVEGVKNSHPELKLEIIKNTATTFLG